MGKKVTKAEALLPLRTTVLLLLAVLAGIGGGLLLATADRSLPEAVIGGLIAAGGALTLFSELVGE